MTTVEENIDVIDRLRRSVVDMCAGPEGGHLGGSLSCLELLVAVARHHAPNPPAVVLSKGHAAIALYAVLAEFGFLDHESLQSFCRPGSDLSTHANSALEHIPASTGSLGHGLAFATGWAVSKRRDATPSTVHVVLGDGELQEGSVFEAARVAAALKVRNLVALVDLNGAQQSGLLDSISPIRDLASIWAGLGWNVYEIEDGHSLDSLDNCLVDIGTAAADTPSVMLCRTKKAHGIPLLEGKASSHFVTLNERKRQKLEESMNTYVGGQQR